jgi:hypothetical protein
MRNHFRSPARFQYASVGSIDSIRFLWKVAFSWIWICPILLGSVVLAMETADEQPAPKLDQAKVDFFETNIRPLLIEHCYECHSSSKDDNSGELRLDTASGLLKGGARGPAISKDSPAESLLLKVVLYDNPDMQMPPAGKLPQEKIDAIRSWLEQGAVDPRVDSAPAMDAKSIREQAVASHWSFQPLPAPSPMPTPPNETNPAESNRNITTNTIDRILDEKLASASVTANNPASQRELIRRLFYDLLGLMPTWEQYQALEHQSKDQYESMVDQTLASPHFGERFARHWMDVSRYADNKGYTFQEDREYAHAWRYREWLIDSFNKDLPFDQFAMYQLAADRMDPGPENRNFHAMGFLTLGRRFLNSENDIADDRIDVATRGLLGLSVTCARCHDHKFDAIGMDDYYSLHAAMVSSIEPKEEPGVLLMKDADSIRPAVIFQRGNAGSPGATVEKKFVKFLTSVTRPMVTGSGRLEVAQAIANRDNPLTARVYVNRIWGWIMGAPLVDTPSDFGLRCPKPVQAELLDSMAAEFVADGWSTKRLIKRILMSQAYRRSSAWSQAAFDKDPENLLWWRAVRKRMDLESLRDSVLVATNQLDPTLGGASIRMMDAPFSNRRTLYAYIDRQNLPGVFRSFDFASPDTHVPIRLSTTVPQQGLFMMNSPMMDQLAVAMSTKLLEQAKGTEAKDAEQTQAVQTDLIQKMFQSILLRQPTDIQMDRCRAYLLQGQASQEANPISLAWQDLAKSLLCTNEFCFVD